MQKNKNARIIGVVLIIISLILFKNMADIAAGKGKVDTLSPDYVSEDENLTVYVNTSNGEEQKELHIKNGDKLPPLDIPQKEGKEFTHWATHNYSVDGSEKIDLDKPITNHTSIYAHYKDIPVVHEVKVTKENYEKIKRRMTIEQVEEIFGRPDSTSETETNGYKVVIYTYKNTDTSLYTFTFMNGKLDTKNYTSF